MEQMVLLIVQRSLFIFRDSPHHFVALRIFRYLRALPQKVRGYVFFQVLRACKVAYIVEECFGR